MILAAIGGGAKIVGGLIGAKNARSDAKLNYQISMYNAEIGRQNTLAGIAITRVQNQAALGHAETNFLLANSDAEARVRNADRMRLFAETRTKEGRQGIQRQIRDFERFQSSQAATVAGSGVSFEGSVLDVLADSAGQMQMTLQDMSNQIGLDRDQAMSESTLERFAAGNFTIAAQAELDSAKSAARTNEMIAALGTVQANQQYQAAKFGAQANRYKGFDSSAGQYLSTAGGAFTGAAQYYSNKQAKPAKPYAYAKQLR